MKCQDCKYFWTDWSTGYSECTKADRGEMTDKELDEYELFGGIEDCQYFEEAPDIYWNPPVESEDEL